MESKSPKIITYSSLKGGIGKSSLTILTAANLAARGKKVLVIDFDPNNSTTVHFTSGIDNIRNVLQEKNVWTMYSTRNITNSIIPTFVPGVDIIGSSLQIFRMRSLGINDINIIFRRDKSEQVADYDFIIIDTAPTYDNTVLASVIVADLIITPVKLDWFNLSTSGFYQGLLYDDAEKKLDSWFLLPNLWNQRLDSYTTSDQYQFLQMFVEKFGTKCLSNKIPQANAISNYVNQRKKLSVNSSENNPRFLAMQLNNYVTDLIKTLTGEDSTPPEEF